MESIIQKINFLKNEICFFLKFEKRISFKFRFRNLHFGKLVKVNFIFRVFFFANFFSLIIPCAYLSMQHSEVATRGVP